MATKLHLESSAKDAVPLQTQSLIEGGPKSITLLPTYRCTAACEQCCFGSNPNVVERMSLEEMLAVVDEAVASFPALRLLVVSGGECYMLGDDLMRVIERAHAKGLLVRTVTNGFWGKSKNAARRVAQRAADAGLTEANFSTGRDHAKFVPIESVINAATSCVEAGIFTLVTVEQDASDSSIYAQISQNAEIQRINRNQKYFQLRVNSWMQFTREHVQRGDASSRNSTDAPCAQLYENMVITPKKNASSCCGLTFEYIPEMKLGRWPDLSLRELYEQQASDFLKMWIHVDGPISIVKKVAPERAHLLQDSEHICQACARMFHDQQIRRAIRERYMEHIPEVLTKFKFKRELDASGINFT
jgi:hypothetical protein